MPTSAGSSKKAREFQKNVYFCFIDYAKGFDSTTNCGNTNCGKFFKRWEYRPPDLPPENSVCSSGATVRTGHRITAWFQIGKGVHQGCILSSCLFNLYAEYIMRNVGLDEAQAGIKIAGRNISNLRHADDTTLMAENEELKMQELLMKVKKESKKVDLKLNIKKLRSWLPVPSLHGK